MKPPRNLCVQCGKPLTIYDKDLLGNNHYGFYCAHAECPNYALVQVPEEQMIKLEKETL